VAAQFATLTAICRHGASCTTCKRLDRGKPDTITPPFVGEKFHELIKNSELHLVDKCGHAPMMELPKQYNEIFGDFLEKYKKTGV